MTVLDVFKRELYTRAKYGERTVLIKISEEDRIDSIVTSTYVSFGYDCFKKIIKGLEKINNFVITVYKFDEYLKSVNLEDFFKMDKDEEKFKEFVRKIFDFLVFVEDSKS